MAEEQVLNRPTPIIGRRTGVIMAVAFVLANASNYTFQVIAGRSLTLDEYGVLGGFLAVITVITVDDVSTPSDLGPGNRIRRSRSESAARRRPDQVHAQGQPRGRSGRGAPFPTARQRAPSGGSAGRTARPLHRAIVPRLDRSRQTPRITEVRRVGDLLHGSSCRQGHRRSARAHCWGSCRRAAGRRDHRGRGSRSSGSAGDLASRIGADARAGFGVPTVVCCTGAVLADPQHRCPPRSCRLRGVRCRAVHRRRGARQGGALVADRRDAGRVSVVGRQQYRSEAGSTSCAKRRSRRRGSRRHRRRSALSARTDGLQHPLWRALRGRCRRRLEDRPRDDSTRTGRIS